MVNGEFRGQQCLYSDPREIIVDLKHIHLMSHNNRKVLGVIYSNLNNYIEVIINNSIARGIKLFLQLL